MILSFFRRLFGSSLRNTLVEAPRPVQVVVHEAVAMRDNMRVYLEEHGAHGVEQDPLGAQQFEDWNPLELAPSTTKVWVRLLGAPDPVECVAVKLDGFWRRVNDGALVAPLSWKPYIQGMRLEYGGDVPVQPEVLASL